MEHSYTITKASLKGNEKQCELPFALVFKENSVFYLETFLEDNFFVDDDFSCRFNLEGLTEKGYKIEIKDLTFMLFKHDNKKAKFVCRNYIKLTAPEKNFPKKDNEKEDSIFFIEIEGFKTKFANHTEIKKYRQYGEVKDFNVNFDHKICAMHIQIDGYEENYFHLVFSNAKSNGNILIDFTKNGGYGRLSYKHFLKFKRQFLGFLSLLNGGDVYIRRELTGEFYRTDGSDSHIVYNYSFTQKSNYNTSDYVPINEHHSYSSSIFSQSFLNCFNNYYHEDLRLELSSIVSSINAAYSTAGIHEAYSILINALEKICSNFQKVVGEFEEYIVDNDIWEENIKSLLLETLESNKSLINSNNKNAFNIFKSKIGDINRRKNSTVQKMYDLFEYGCIPLNKNVESLVTKERHQAVHNGVFGENSNEMFLNYKKLDYILRDLVLNIINYRSYRKAVYEYASLEERKKAYPERKREQVTYLCSQPIRK